MDAARVILLPRRARPFYGRHPWVYAGAVAEVRGEPADGDEVELYSHAADFIARGLYNSKSKIRVRLYSWSPETALNAEFFRARLDQAIRLRTILGLIPPSQSCPTDGGRASDGAGGSVSMASHVSPTDGGRASAGAGGSRSMASPIDGGRTACRLVFSEGDGLSGLTVDRYDRWL